MSSLSAVPRRVCFSRPEWPGRDTKLLLLNRMMKSIMAADTTFFIYPVQTFREFNLEEPKDDDGFYVGSFTQNRSRSALTNHPKKSDSQEILVLRRHSCHETHGTMGR